MDLLLDLNGLRQGQLDKLNVRISMSYAIQCLPVRLYVFGVLFFEVVLLGGYP